MLIAIYAAPSADALELNALKNVFSLANEKVRPEAHYAVRIVTHDFTLPFPSSPRRPMLGDIDLAGMGDAVDTLIVIGSEPLLAASAELLDWLHVYADETRRWAALGTGAFALGTAGLLDGRKATTQWQYADALQKRFPAAHIEPDRTYVRDGALITYGSESAAIDLALALIEEDHGRLLALSIAHKLIIDLDRAGGKPKQSLQLAAQAPSWSPIRRVQAWIHDHPDKNLSITNLADVAAMSVRNFARVFKREVGMGPAAFVELTRVDHARRLLENSDLPLHQVAVRSGFLNHDAARRAFRRRTGLSPAQYRMLNRQR